MFALTINGKTFDVDAEPETPLLWVLRDTLGLTGTKFGCGAGHCGSCTVHVDGRPMRSCTLGAGAMTGRDIVTIEAIAQDANHPVIAAWIEEQVPQCGYCQAGQIMTAAALLRKQPQPSDEQIEQSLAGNLCRCGTYTRIRAAVKKAAGL